MKGLISLKAFANEIKDLKFVDEVREVEDDLINIKIHDDELTREQYEFGGQFYTDGFVEKMTKKLNEVWSMCMGMIAEFVKLEIDDLDDGWFAVWVSAK